MPLIDYDSVREGWLASRRASRGRRAAGRDPATVALLAVSKTFPAEAVRAAHALGQRAFGENYVQEALAKMDATADLAGIEWHLIGPLQSNKARDAAERFAWVHTIDRAQDRASGCRGAARRTCRRSTSACRSTSAARRRRAASRRPRRSRSRRRSRGCRGCACAGSWASPSRPTTSRGSARSSGCCASASRLRAPRGSPSTRCRWACRRTSKRRSPRARRWCASAARCSARARAAGAGAVTGPTITSQGTTT